MVLSSLLSFLIPAIVIIVVLKIISIPFKLFVSFMVNLLLGGLLLYALVSLGVISITLTWWMTALVGILGIPGAIAVAILSFII